MPWKVVSVLWPAIVAALQPLDLAELVVRLPDIVLRLTQLDAVGGDRANHDRSQPHQVDDFRSRFASQLSTAA